MVRCSCSAEWYPVVAYNEVRISMHMNKWAQLNYEHNIIAAQDTWFHFLCIEK
jgi:hypothetical protein